MSKAPRDATLSQAPITALAFSIVPAFLDARFLRPGHRIEVTFTRPVEQGRPETITGALLGTMYARGAIHHHRVAAQGTVWLVPTVWLTPAARKAAQVFGQAQQDTDIPAGLRALLTMLRKRKRKGAGSEAGT